jgi:hypothetical protein
MRRMRNTEMARALCRQVQAPPPAADACVSAALRVLREFLVDSQWPGAIAHALLQLAAGD